MALNYHQVRILFEIVLKNDCDTNESSDSQVGMLFDFMTFSVMTLMLNVKQENFHYDRNRWYLV